MSDISEVWLPVVGAESGYLISNLGNLMTLDRCIIDTIGRKRVLRGKRLKGYIDWAGYRKASVVLNNGKPKILSLHRLVAMAFIPNPEKSPRLIIKIAKEMTTD